MGPIAFQLDLLLTFQRKTTASCIYFLQKLPNLLCHLNPATSQKTAAIQDYD
jgi:hypothetical protein